jgi:dipeptidyl aminopeptidase/acylaminoacyl peptidase
MRYRETLFTPQLLLSVPRRSHGVPNPSGTTVLFTMMSYSFQEHSQKTTLQALLVQTGETIDITVNQNISHINWLDDVRFVCLRSEKDGKTSFLYADFSATGKNSKHATALQSAGIINASVSGMKIARINHDCDDFAVVVSAPACRSGRLYTPADAARKTNSTGRLYHDLFVRHWDRYEGPDKSSLWYGKLSSAGEGRYKLSGLSNLLAGTNMECPIQPFGGSDHFDVRKDAVIWVAKDPELNPSWNTKCKVFVGHIDSWAPEECMTELDIRQIDVAGFSGAAVSPVFAPVGDKAAFLMMRKNKYEADKNQIIVVTDVTAPRFEIVRACCSSEQSQDEGTWDRSPSSVCFAADGQSIIAVAEDQAYGRVFFIRGEDIAGTGIPHPLTHLGTAVDVRCLIDGRIFVSGTSMVDNSWYLITHNPAEIAEVPPGTLPKEAWSHSNSDQGHKLGLQRSQISCAWTTASNPEITEKIHSWIFKPSTFDRTKKYPVAYLIHGGPHAAWRDSWSTRWNPAVFAEQGYIVVAPNISGSTGFGQAFTNSSFRNWGGDPYYDLVNVFEWVGQNLEGADNDRAVALGHSYGGYMVGYQAQTCDREWLIMSDQLDSRARSWAKIQGIGLSRRDLQLDWYVLYRGASFPLSRDGWSTLATRIRKVYAIIRGNPLWPASMGSEREFESMEHS